MSEVVYLRDLDGTGSLHACLKGDPGAIAHIPLELADQLAEALDKARLGFDIAEMNTEYTACDDALESYRKAKGE